jgi:hypothetical protein
MANVVYEEVKLNTSGARAHAGRPGDPPAFLFGERLADRLRPACA